MFATVTNDAVDVIDRSIRGSSTGVSACSVSDNAITAAAASTDTEVTRSLKYSMTIILYTHGVFDDRVLNAKISTRTTFDRPKTEVDGRGGLESAET